MAAGPAVLDCGLAADPALGRSLGVVADGVGGHRRRRRYRFCWLGVLSMVSACRSCLRK